MAPSCPSPCPGASQPPLVIVAGTSPRLPLDDGYRSFLHLLLVSVSGALGTVSALESERQRAAALAALDRAKTAFFSNVSHEFRTPLTLLLGPLDDALAQPEALSMTLREPLILAQRNGLRLLKLVNSLLDFSRIEAGRMAASFEPVDLVAVTKDLAANFRSVTARGGVELVVEGSPLPGPVHVDRDMWERVVLNLLSNDAPTKGRASDWHWCRNWSSCMAATSVSSASWDRGPPSACGCHLAVGTCRWRRGRAPGRLPPRAREPRPISRRR